MKSIGIGIGDESGAGTGTGQFPILGPVPHKHDADQRDPGNN
jgi:hypothetical protein